MNNFQAHHNEFRFKASVSPAVGNKQTFAVLDIMYLKGSQHKGILASLKRVEIEQGEGYSTETSVIFGDGNFSMWVKYLPRKSDKEVVRVAEALDSKVVDIVAAFILSPRNGKAELISAVESIQAVLS